MKLLTYTLFLSILLSACSSEEKKTVTASDERIELVPDPEKYSKDKSEANKDTIKIVHADTISTICSILDKHDKMGPDKVNMDITYEELISCAPILIKYIKKHGKYRLRVHGIVFNKIEYFTLNAWYKPKYDTIYEINVIRTEADFDKVIVSPQYLFNRSKEYVILGDLRAGYDSTHTIFSFIKNEFPPFNVTKWEEENNREYIYGDIIKYTKQDTILIVPN